MCHAFTPPNDSVRLQVTTIIEGVYRAVSWVRIDQESHLYQFGDFEVLPSKDFQLKVRFGKCSRTAGDRLRQSLRIIR